MKTHEIMEKIGRGKYSDVFKCINTENDAFACIKVLKPGIFYPLCVLFSQGFQNQKGNQDP